MGISTMTTILLTFMNAGESVNEKFAYNLEIENEIVTAQLVYQKSDDGKYLSNHLRYNFVYDEKGRVLQKEVLNWDEWTHNWKRSHVYNYTYNTLGFSIEYVKWNDVQKEYTELLAKQTYEETVDGFLAFSAYEWDKNGQTWVKQNNILLESSPLEYLASLQKKSL